MLAPKSIEIEPNNTNMASCFGEMPPALEPDDGAAAISGCWGSDMFEAGLAVKRFRCRDNGGTTEYAPGAPWRPSEMRARPHAIALRHLEPLYQRANSSLNF